MYYNIETKETAEKLPCKAIIGTQTFASIQPLDLALLAKVGWREVVPAKVNAGEVVTARTYTQDGKNALKVQEIVAVKTTAELAAEAKAVDDVQTAARAEYEARLEAKREEIRKAFPDEAQQKVVLAIYERMPFA